MVGWDEGELGTLRSVVDGLRAHGGRAALVAVGEEGVEIWTYGELAGRVLGPGRGLRGAGVERSDQGKLLRRLEQVMVTFGEPFDPRCFHEKARPQEQIVEAVRERVAELGAR